MNSTTDMADRVAAAIDRNGQWQGNLRDSEILELAKRGYGTWWNLSGRGLVHSVEHNVTLAEANLEALT